MENFDLSRIFIPPPLMSLKANTEGIFQFPDVSKDTLRLQHLYTFPCLRDICTPCPLPAKSTPHGGAIDRAWGSLTNIVCLLIVMTLASMCCADRRVITYAGNRKLQGSPPKNSMKERLNVDRSENGPNGYPSGSACNHLGASSSFVSGMTCTL